MKQRNSKIDVNRLREIGWSKWDPIGLSNTEGSWKAQPFEDEYDTYLIKAAGMLRNGSDPSEVVNYLHHIETVHMGLGPAVDGHRSRAKIMAVVNEISNDPRIWIDFEN
jgi:hypothetical protein